MSDISIDKLNQLHPLIRQSALDAYAEAVKETPENVHPIITETFRSFAESDKLYAQGRTEPGKIVTNSKGGQSYHNYSLAIDGALIVNGELSYIVNDNWMKVVKCFKDHGFEWGGEFHSIKDYPHFQKTMGYKWQELLEKYHNKEFIEGTEYLNL